MITISTDSFGNYGLHRIFGFVKKAGFEGIEISISKNYDTKDPEYLAELSNQFDLPIVALSLSKKTTKTGVLKMINIAKKLKCQVVVIQPPELLDFSLASWIKREIPVLRKKEKIHICMENSDASTFLGIIPKYAMNTLVDLRNFKSVCLNTSNLASKKIDLMKIYDKLKPVIRHIHLSNAKASKGNLFLDNGTLPLESFLMNLKKNDYKAAISLKLMPKELHVGHTDKLIKRLKEAKAYIDKYYV